LKSSKNILISFSLYNSLHYYTILKSNLPPQIQYRQYLALSLFSNPPIKLQHYINSHINYKKVSITTLLFSLFQSSLLLNFPLYKVN
jgi:hypothetical protein